MKRTPAAPAPARDPFSVKTSSLFFGSSSLGGNLEPIESWQPGAEPLIAPRASAYAPRAAVPRIRNRKVPRFSRSSLR